MGFKMPWEVTKRCKNCGYPLYEVLVGEKMGGGAGVNSNKCPKCGEPIPFEPYVEPAVRKARAAKEDWYPLFIPGENAYKISVDVPATAKITGIMHYISGELEVSYRDDSFTGHEQEPLSQIKIEKECSDAD
jgi:hypothetical protein